MRQPLQLLRRVVSTARLIKDISYRVDDLQRAVGRIEARQLAHTSGNLRDREFKVYSQTGEDGIIQFLIGCTEIPNKVFVEFGVQNYKESNTRFLLQNNYWSGLVMDGSAADIEFIKNDPIYWRYNLKAEHAFIDRDNINQLLRANGITGDIGLLSVDIDGNDYWVWQAIDCISPRILICEYNSLWGCDRKVTIPYNSSFVRTAAHFSNVYYGASVAALAHLGQAKGYALVGSNQFGNNLFFVRNDVLGSLPVWTPRQAWVEAGFRESRDEQGELTYLPFEQRLLQVADKPLYDIEQDALIRVGDVISSGVAAGNQA